MDNLSQLLDFIKFTHKFQKIQRQIYVANEDRLENDAEHSIQLALVAWYIIQTYGLKLNIEKVIKYSISHDLVEIYAGDTFFHSKNEQEKFTIEARERKALEIIKAEFPNFLELNTTIKEYEDQQNNEAKFIYALDKVLAALNIYIDGGRIWKEKQVTFEMEHKVTEKVIVSKEITKIWEKLIVKLEENKEKLFI